MSSSNTAFVGGFAPAPRTSGSAFSGDAVTCNAQRPARGVSMVLGTKPTIGFGAFGTATDTKTYTVTVLQGGSSSTIQVTREQNLRKAMLDNKIDVYTLKGKLTNCGGGGSCGTCLIAIEDGMYNTNGRAAREDIMLESKPDNFRLACRTQIHGDVTIRTKPKQ